jgi:hypothetical protein
MYRSSSFRRVCILSLLFKTDFSAQSRRCRRTCTYSAGYPLPDRAELRIIRI